MPSLLTHLSSAYRTNGRDVRLDWLTDGVGFIAGGMRHETCVLKHEKGSDSWGG